MDGVDQLNNILIIGMTNRLDMIDEALLRPGRLEVHMEISLPDEKGRIQILTIHTAKMRANGIMDGDVDLSELVPSVQPPRKKPPKRAQEKDDLGPPKPCKRSSHYKDPSENRPARTFHGPVTLTPPRMSSSSSRMGDAP